MMKGPRVELKERLTIKIEKNCGCCKKSHTYLPTGSVQKLNLFWFNCQCGSTLVIKTEKL